MLGSLVVWETIEEHFITSVFPFRSLAHSFLEIFTRETRDPGVKIGGELLRKEWPVCYRRRPLAESARKGSFPRKLS